MREVRCWLGEGEPCVLTNTWAGTGVGGGTGGFLIIRVAVEGPIDARTGYLCDIREIDAVVRGSVVLRLRGGASGLAVEELGERLPGAFLDSAPRFRPATVLRRIELHVSPFTRVAVDAKDVNMVQVTQCYEFAAAHRLHCAELSDAENARLFGKCSNPHGHGHNYLLEVTVAGDVGTGGRVMPLSDLDRVVQEHVLTPFDHRNLNAECAEFRELNPTVENIASVIWRRLVDKVLPARLVKVRVWETGKTFAECESCST